MTLDQWIAWAPVLDHIYQEELGRSAFSDPEAFVNWTYHWRENQASADAVRAAIRESPEWRQRHGAESPTSPDVPPTPTPITGGGRVIQVTNSSDGDIRPRMMSDRANAFIVGHAPFPTYAIVFCGTDDGPRFFKVHLDNGQVDRIGQLVPFGGETEGWYWTKTGRVVISHGPRLLSVDPFTGDQRELLNVHDRPGHDLWQPHSSDDGRTHSATVRRIVSSGRYPYVGTIVQGPHGRRFEPAIGQLDESQVTRDGSHVVIKQNGEDNRIIELASGAVWDLRDEEGAIGHSDCGPGFVVGESNLPGPGRCVKLDLRTRQRTDLFHTDNMGYVSVRAGVCVNSDDTHLWRVSLDGAGRTPLLAHGATNIRNADGSYNYDNRPKANLDPTGRIACYINNPHGRRDVFLLIL